MIRYILALLLLSSAALADEKISDLQNTPGTAALPTDATVTQSTLCATGNCRTTVSQILRTGGINAAGDESFSTVGNGTVNGNLTINGNLGGSFIFSNLNTAGTYQQNGIKVFDTLGAGGSGTLVIAGQGAGASLPSNALNMVAIGFNALGSDTGTNSENVAVGWGSLRNVTTGQFNTAVGLNTGGLFVTDSHNTLFGNDAMRDSSGSSNIGVGDSVLRDGTHTKSVAIGAGGAFSAFGLTSSNTSDNTVVGYAAFSSSALSTASSNTVIGSQAMQAVTTGNSNVAAGFRAGQAITSGSSNVAIGPLAGSGTTAGGANVFIGLSSGVANTTGSNSVGVGQDTLLSFTGTGGAVAVGNQAGKNLTTGISTLMGSFAGLNLTTGTNTAVGQSALLGAASSTASLNTAIGDSSLSAVTTANQDTAVGRNSCNKITTGFTNLCLGHNVGSTTLATGNNNILIGTGTGTDTVASNTSNEVNIGGLLFWNQNSLAAPAVTSCGTSPTIDAHANNRSGTVTIGTAAPASCTVTFAGTGYATWNHCRVTPETTLAAFGYSYTKTVLTITGTALSGSVDYDCDGV